MVAEPNLAWSSAQTTKERLFGKSSSAEGGPPTSYQVKVNKGKNVVKGEHRTIECRDSAENSVEGLSKIQEILAKNEVTPLGMRFFLIYEEGQKTAVWVLSLKTAEDVEKAMAALGAMRARLFDYRKNTRKVHFMKLAGVPLHLEKGQILQLFPDAISATRHESPLWKGVLSDVVSLRMKGAAPSVLQSSRLSLEDDAVEATIVSIDKKPVCYGCHHVGHTRSQCTTHGKRNATEGRGEPPFPESNVTQSQEAQWTEVLVVEEEAHPEEPERVEVDASQVSEIEKACERTNQKVDTNTQQMAEGDTMEVVEILAMDASEGEFTAVQQQGSNGKRRAKDRTPTKSEPHNVAWKKTTKGQQLMTSYVGSSGISRSLFAELDAIEGDSLMSESDKVTTKEYTQVDPCKAASSSLSC